MSLGSTGMFQKDIRHSLVNSLYTSSAAAKLTGPMDQAYSADFLGKLGLDANGNAPTGSTFVSRVIPVGTTVQQYSDNDAKVAVWYVGLIGMSGQASTDPVTTSWKTWTFDLQWSDGDWKIVTDSQKDGPAPVPGDAHGRHLGRDQQGHRRVRRVHVCPVTRNACSGSPEL